MAPAVHKPISEHDPLWREAVVAVDAVEKGHHPGDQAVVQFPASRDVAWYRVPKLQEGQQGVFLLHKPPVAGRARRLAAVVRFGDGSPTATSRVEPRTQESDIDWALSGEAVCAGLFCMQLEFDRSASGITA